MIERPHQVSLCLFGAPSLVGAVGSPNSDLLARPKSLALIAYLAVADPRGLHRRDELLALFWPDSDTGHARNSLRQGLHALRSVLPAGAITSRGSHEVGLECETLHVDVWQFERALGDGRESDALATYSGDLLANFTLPDNPQFDRWLGLQRVALRRRAVQAAMLLAKRSELDGDHARSSEWARYALARAPHDEPLLRDVVELLHRAGDRAGAADVIDAAAVEWETELGVTLSSETTQLARSLSRIAYPALHAERSSDTFVASDRDHGTSNATAQRARHATPLPLVPPRAVSFEARRLYLQAKQLASQRSPVTITEAIETFECALRLSPDYAEAHAGIASAYCQAPVYSPMLGTDAWPRVRAHASRALRLDPRIGEAHTFLAHASLCSEYDWRSAGQGYRRALELDSISWVSRQLYALYFLTCLGRADEAMAILERARDQMPDIPGISAFCGMSCLFSRRFERALAEMKHVLQSDPRFVQAYWVQGAAREATGDFAGAIASFEQGAAITGDSALFTAQLARACANGGDPARARHLLKGLDDRGDVGGPGAYFRVEALAALGETEQALDALHIVYRQRNPLMVFAGVSVGLDPLRGTNRFRDLLARIGLPGRVS